MKNLYFGAVYFFETTAHPEEVFERLAKEQTTTGYNTLKREYAGLKDFQAVIEELNFTINGSVYKGKVIVNFPTINLNTNGNLFEDILCFSIGESKHIFNILKLTLVDIILPDEIEDRFDGPKYGVEGIRKKLGVQSRPLLLGPMRPEVGFSPKEYSEIAFEAFAGGFDLIKDDELLCSPSYCPIFDRAKLCATAARKAEDKTGERKMYFLNIGSDLSQINYFIDIGVKNNVDGFMIHPRLNPSIINFTRERTNLPLIIHYELLPSITHGIQNGINLSLLIKVYRLSGGDIISFPRPNERFDIDTEEYEECLRKCVEKYYRTQASFPMPTGGNTARNINECRHILDSNDYIFVTGSALFEDQKGIFDSAKAIRGLLNGEGK